LQRDKFVDFIRSIIIIQPYQQIIQSIHLIDYAPVRGLLLVYRRCVAVADVSGQFSQIWSDMIRCGPMWSDAVISHTA